MFVIATLGFAAIQTEISAKAAKTSASAVQASAWAAASTAALQTDQAFAQSDPNGALEPYFESKARIPASESEPHLYRRFERLAVMQLHLMNLYMYVGSSTFLPGTFLDKDALQRWLWWTFADSPDLCKVLDDQQNSYSAYFVTEAASACSYNGYRLTPHHRDKNVKNVNLWIH